MEPAAKDLEEAVTAYLRRATETFDLSKNVEVSNTRENIKIIEFPVASQRARKFKNVQTKKLVKIK